MYANEYFFDLAELLADENEAVLAEFAAVAEQVRAEDQSWD